MAERRASLQDVLARCSAAQVVLVQGPHGSGRTTFAELLVRGAATGLRVQVERRDRTIDHVLARLVSTAALAGQTILAEAGMGESGPDERLAGLGEVLRRHPGPVVLAFDDVDLLDNTVRDRLRDLPVCTVLTARGFGDAELADGTVLVDAAELAGSGRADDLDERVGVLLAELTETGLVDVPAALGSLPLLSAAVADAIGDRQLLARLDRAGLPLTPQQRPGWWRLPERARQLLAAHGTIPEETALTVAGVYARAGHLLHAVDVLSLAGRLDRLPTVLAVLPPVALDTVDLHQLALLVAAGATGAPVSDRVRAFLALADPAAGRGDLRLHGRILDQLEQLMDELAAGVPPEVHRQVTRAVDAQRLRRDERRIGTLQDARALVDRATALLAECGDDEVRTRAVTLFVRGTTAAWTREAVLRPTAQTSLVESAALFRFDGDQHGEAAALIALAYRVYAPLAELDRAIALLEEAMALLPRQSRQRALCLTYLAEVAVIIGYDEVAARSLEEALDLSHLRVDDMAVGYAAWERAHLAAELGDVTACDRWCAVAEDHPGEWIDNRAGVAFLAQQVEWAARQGRLAEARARLARATSHAAKHGYPGQLLAAQASVAALEGRFAEALQLYAASIDAGHVDGETWRSRLELGWLHWQVGDHVAARARALEVVADLDVCGHPELALRREPVRWTELLRLLDSSPPDGSSVDASPGSALADQSADERVGQPAAQPIGQPIGQLRVRVLGEVSVVVGGEAVEVRGSRPRTLLVLLACAGRPMSVDELGDQLWPDLDSVLARQRLRNVITRVRSCGPVVERRGDTLAMTADTRVDAQAFQTAAERALRLGPTADPQRLESEALAALELYGGPLCLESDARDVSHLHAVRFERLAVALLDCVVAAALRRGELDVAVAALDRLSEVDPADDRPPSRAAGLLRAAGRDAEADLFERRAALIRGS